MVRHMLKRDVGHEYVKLHDHARALQAVNLRSNVDIKVEHKALSCPPFFKWIYVWFSIIEERFFSRM